MSTMSLRFASFALVAALSFSAACGNDGKNNLPPPVSEMVGASGGRIDGPGGTTVVVPAGATSDDTLITVSQIAAPASPTGTAQVAIPIRLEPSGKTFDQAVQITLTLSETGLPAGTTAGNVIVLRTETGTTNWTPVPTIASGPGTITALTEHFSDFIAIVVTDESPDAGSPFGTCGDDVCDGSTETCGECPYDCGLCFDAVDVDICGDGTCTGDESCGSCPWECACDSLCEFQNGGCDPNATCSEASGAIECACPNGTLDYYGNGTLCAQDGPCMADSCMNGGTCIDGEDHHICVCPDGVSGVVCEVMPDPCQPDPCQNGGSCDGTSGSAVCTCSAAYTGTFCEQDVDECALSADNCDVNATCTNVPGSFTCACNGGYLGDGVNCSDVLLCGNGTREGGEACDDGNTTPGDGCATLCAAEPGYTCDTASPTVCVDQDECTAMPTICGPGMCFNTPGTFACMCDPGYENDPTTGLCVDTDECQIPEFCGSYSTCVNLPGSAQCNCVPGATVNGTACDPGDCGPNLTVVTNGMVVAPTTVLDSVASLQCDPGYEAAGTTDAVCVWDGSAVSWTPITATCTDIDECALGTDGCQLPAVCVNQPGTFVCQ